MLCVIGRVDMTASIPHDSIKIDTVAGDPASKASFQLIDPGSQIALQPLQEVIFIDEAAQLGGNTLIPAANYLGNNNFNYGSDSWGESGALTGRITFPTSGTFGSSAVATLTFSNQAVGTDSRLQDSANSGYRIYIVPGQQYCFSATINVTTPFTNSYAFLQIVFLDSNNNVLSTTTSSHITSSSGAQRFSVTATAPANAINGRAAFGGTTTSTTNSGTATFTALQFEPVWFPSLYSYPTPICDFLQADSITLRDGSAARFDRIFTGNITHRTATYEGTTRTWDVEVTGVDGWLENATLVNATYNSTTDQSIIVGIVSNVPNFVLNATIPSVATGTPQALAYRNIPVVYSGATMASIEYSDATPREVLNSIVDTTGFLFGIDPYYNVFYYPPFYNAAPYGLSSSPDNVATFAYYDYSIEYDDTQLQNIINVSGNIYPLTVTESWNAQDGSHTEFTSGGNTFAFVPLHNPNQISMTLTIGGTTYPCVANTNNAFTANPQAIVDENYPLFQIFPYASPSTAISLNYTCNALVYIQAQSPDSIASLGRLLYSKINDTNLASNAQAATRGEAQLQTYAQSRVTLKFKTQAMFSPGQIIEFTSAVDSLTKAHYAVQKVTATYLGNGLNQYEIEAGTYVDDFVDFFRNTQKAVNRADHSASEPIKQYNNLQQDSASYTDSLNIHT